MRWNLLRKFSEIYILDLHGNVMGRDAADSEERDENILDIQLGVCISFLLKRAVKILNMQKCIIRILVVQERKNISIY